MKSNGKEVQILNLLRSAGNDGITNVEMSKIALRYGGYLGSLYQKGYKIKKEHIGYNVFKYTLISEPDVDFSVKKSAKEVLLDNVEMTGLCSKESLQNLLDDLGLSVRYKSGTHL